MESIADVRPLPCFPFTSLTRFELTLRSNYRPDIDGLRALAVTLVVIFHFDLGPLSGGYIGVDVFFVISGFLITSLVQAEIVAGKFSFTRFWVRRARRILPASIFMMLVVALVFAVIYPTYLYQAIGESLIAQTFFAANVHFWSDADYFSSAAELKPLLHMWSLAVEEQFYLIFPAILLAFHKLMPSRGLSIVGIVGTLCIISLALSITLTHLDRAAAFYLLPTRAWELGIGALLALTRLPVGSAKTGFALSATGLSFIVLAAVLFDADTPFPSWQALAPTVGAALVIWGNSTPTNPLRTLFSLKPFVFVGLVSYSLYLWHWPVAVLFDWLSMPPGWSMYGIAALALTVVMTLLSYHFVERPVRENHNLYSDSRVVGGSFGMVCLMFFVGLVAARLGNGSIVDSDGKIERFRNAATLSAPLLNDCIDLVKRGSDSVSCARHHGDPQADADFFIWGDSHAAAVLPAFDVAAQILAYNFEFSITNGCQAVIGMRRTDENVGCVATSESVLQHLRDRQVPIVVLISSYVSNVTAGRLRDVDAPMVVDPARAKEEFATRIAETVVEIKKTGARVVLFTEPPRFNRNPVTDHIRAMTLGSIAPAATVSRETHEERLSEVYKLVDGAGIDFRMDYADQFCDSRNCRWMQGNDSLYRDGSHLSLLGAQLLAEPISADLRFLIEAKRGSH